jgi:subtilisin family serine protease
MSSTRPAFSSAFSPDALRGLTRLPPVDDITSDWAWDGSTGRGVKVAIIDSGIDASHPGVGGAIAGYVAVKEAEAGGLVYDTSEHEDAWGHGTACAGIIRTLAPECELYSVKVLGKMLRGRGSVFAAGLRWAIENGMHVCNLSLGTTKRDFFAVLHELVDLAYYRNTLLVAAANNMPSPSFPSVFSSVISVASHDVRDDDLFYYNPSPPVEFGALGIDVRVPWLGGAWLTATGNSFAAPHITGIVARILGKRPGLTLFQVKVILRALSANMGSEAALARPDASDAGGSP